MLRLLTCQRRAQTKGNRNYRSSLQERDHRFAEAERILKAGRKALGLTDKLLSRMRGSDPRKVAIASVLHRQTTVPQSWIAEQLGMKSAANVSQQVRRMAADPDRSFPVEVQAWLKTVEIC
jgi:hypothetical protein